MRRVVMVPDADEAGRTHGQSARGVGLGVLVGDGTQADTTTAAGRLMFGIYAAPAGLKRELIRERTVAGLKAARRGQGRGSGGRRLGPDAVHRVTRSSMNSLASRRLANAAEGFPLFRLARCLVNLPADGVRLRSGLRSHEPPAAVEGAVLPATTSAAPKSGSWRSAWSTSATVAALKPWPALGEARLTTASMPGRTPFSSVAHSGKVERLIRGS